MKFFNTHFSIEQLADAIDGKENLSGDLNEHLKNCLHCSAEFATLRQTIELMRRDDSRDAPPAALEFAKNIFRARRSEQFIAQTTRTQKILGSLKIDLTTFAPVFGERSTAFAAGERQMLFAAGDQDLDLRVRETENGFVVRGQVLGELSEKCVIRLEGAGFAVETTVDAAGNFSFSPLSSVDDLQVSLYFVE